MATQFINDLITEEITLDRLLAEFPHEVMEDEGKAYALGRKSEAKVRAWAARVSIGADTSTTSETEPLATPAQVDYIMDLLKRGAGDEGGFMNGPTHLSGVQLLTKRDASLYIKSLKGDY